ncbi:hypothetical protein CY34DRAFT_401359 [Suillus luteus UH-Slu-Lm8-n1]|uniref:Uncharacterized protein n=1 Tax=Suillus luteus UH-Slu-Lm8-n1 TaxID=930992 RepID=A0A0D0BA05_9AGAM|nr:hypothetical protein CY34DRAFT_401359 [Suillus luteus UH-Slu-Lm8-n1]
MIAQFRGKRSFPLAETTLTTSRSSTTPGRKIPALQPNPFLTPLDMGSHCPRSITLHLHIEPFQGMSTKIRNFRHGSRGPDHSPPSSLPRDL